MVVNQTNMRNGLMMLGLFLLVVPAVSAQRAKSVLLPAEEGKKVAKQCSRPSPEDFTDTWIPDAEQLRAMESRLKDISRLRAEGCCIEGARVENPEQWYLQYAALVWKGKKIIYVSAIGREPTTDWVLSSDGKTHKEVPNDNWKKFAIIICDGGNAWGVIYFPQTGKFSDLSVNGIG